MQPERLVTQVRLTELRPTRRDRTRRPTVTRSQNRCREVSGIAATERDLQRRDRHKMFRRGGLSGPDDRVLTQAVAALAEAATSEFDFCSWGIPPTRARFRAEITRDLEMKGRCYISCDTHRRRGRTAWAVVAEAAAVIRSFGRSSSNGA